MTSFDLKKFEKYCVKNIETISPGFNDPRIWIDTGNYTLNYLISGRFDRGIPLSKVTLIAGESGSGKSYIASGNVIRNAQKMGIEVIVIDSENALDEEWLKRLGVDTSPEKLLRLQVARVDDVVKIISEFMAIYKEKNGALPLEERPKVLFVIDSLGMLMTESEENQANEGTTKGDMGRMAKSLKALVKYCVINFAEHNIGMVATQHTYSSQSQYEPDDVISGGCGFQYASSIIIRMKKYKLKEDEEGKKIKVVLGIRANIQVAKTRYNKPFETVEIKIPYDTGLNPYSGLVQLFENRNILQKDGKMMGYTDKNGVYHKYYRKDWADDKLEMVLKDVMEQVTAGTRNMMLRSSNEDEEFSETSHDNDEDED